MESLRPSTSSKRSRLTSFRGDVFFYLTCKRDHLDVRPCSSCQSDVFIGNAMKCNGCQGYCHEQCIASSISKPEGYNLSIICKQCWSLRALSQRVNTTESPTSPLPLQRQQYHSVVTVSKDRKAKCINQSPASVTAQNACSKTREASSDSRLAAQNDCSKTREASSDSRLALKNKKRSCSWGIIWRKKNSEDTGFNFRLKNILLKGGSDTHHLEPVCHLCDKPYRSDLMYICCETCNFWYHAEAVSLDESKIFDVVGFKCCRCRRIKSPECPYKEPKEKKTESKKIRAKALKHGNSALQHKSGINSEYEEHERIAPVFPRREGIKEGNDALLFSLSNVEPIPDPSSEADVDWQSASGPVPQKLQVRRLAKREGDTEVSYGSYSILSTHQETSILPRHAEVSFSPGADWVGSADGQEGELQIDYENLNYEDMEFEPQTYFSFTELLAPDGAELDEPDASGNCKNPMSATLQDDVHERCGTETISDQLESAMSEPAVECNVCSQTQPAPDLSCNVCGLSVHSHCSPWLESMPVEANWSCGNCREWR